MSIEVVSEKNMWDGFIDSSPYGTLFHRWDFLKIIEKHSHYHLVPYAIYKEDELISLIPFFLTNKSIIKMAYSPPQFRISNIPYLGFVPGCRFDSGNEAQKEEYWNFMVDEISREMKKRSVNYVSIALDPKLTDIRPFYWNDYAADLQYTYIIDLDRRVEEIWDGFDRDCRKNIKESSTYPLVLKQVKDAATFYEIMGNGLQKNEGDTIYSRQDPQYLADLLEAFPDNIRMYFMYCGEEVIGVKVNFGYKDHFMSWMGNVAMKKNISANEYFYWEFIKNAKSLGYKRFENPGTFVPRVNIFKSKFNPSLEPCFYMDKKDMLYKIFEFGYNNLTRIIKI